MRQHTIKSSFSITGVGLHTGKKVKLTFNPAAINHGYKFKRTDLEDQPVIPAIANKVVSTNRGTTIQSGEAQVSTIEHVLSALAGREYLEIEDNISYRDELTGSELMAIPSNEFEVTTMIDFNSPTLGHQYAASKGKDQYISDIAPCRTFVFTHELEALLNENLIKGGDLSNAIVIADRKMEKEELEVLAKRLGKEEIVVEKTGVLNTVDLRFENEPARHKLLDVMGDLALVGAPIKGKIVATKPGHTSNVEFAKMLRKKYQEQKKLKGRPKYDPDKEPIYDINAIHGFLPHRFPFLLVDKIIELSDTHVVGTKAIGFNEFYFQGHFPNNPIFPGVLQLEAMAQTGGILALSTVEDPQNWDTYFLKIDNAKFKRKVVPGDILVMKLELLTGIRRGIVNMQATAYVGNTIVSEGELVAQIVRRTKE